MTDTRTTEQRRAGISDSDLEGQPQAETNDQELTTADIAADRGPRVEATINSSDGDRTAVVHGDRAPDQDSVQRPVETDRPIERQPPETVSAKTATAPEDSASSETASPLFDESTASQLRERWTDVQAGFVDEPRTAVEKADALVADVMKQLAESFATERKELEGQWSRGNEISTEDLRVALRRYRSFFDRLLSI